MFGLGKKDKELNVFQKITCPREPSNNKEWLAVKFPGNVFNTSSIIEIQPGTVAIAVHAGHIEHVYMNGVSQLSTEHFPGLTNQVGKMFSGNTPFSLDFYYINATAQHQFRYGSSDPLSVSTGFKEDHNKNYRLHYRGEYFLRVKHYQFFYQWILGSLMDGEFVYWDSIASKIETTINEKVRTLIKEYYVQNNLDMNTAEGAGEACSESVMSKLKPLCEEQFGLELQNFNTILIVNPEDRAAHNKQRDEAQQMELRGSVSQAGFERSLALEQMQVMKEAAKNPGTVGQGMGIGMGFGLGGAIFNASQQMGQNSMQNQQPQQPQPQQQGGVCKYCGAPVTPGAKFCPACGKPDPVAQSAFCPHCGQPLTPGALFCPNCGKKVN